MSSKISLQEGILQDHLISYSFIEICHHCIIEEKTLSEMMNHGIIEPVSQTPLTFNFIALLRVRKALRLHQDLAINWEGIALILNLLEERNELYQLIQRLQMHENN